MKAKSKKIPKRRTKFQGIKLPVSQCKKYVCGAIAKSITRSYLRSPSFRHEKRSLTEVPAKARALTRIDEINVSSAPSDNWRRRMFQRSMKQANCDRTSESRGGLWPKNDQRVLERAWRSTS